jgi:hypothetical protein
MLTQAVRKIVASRALSFFMTVSLSELVTV